MSRLTERAAISKRTHLEVIEMPRNISGNRAIQSGALIFRKWKHEGSTIRELARNFGCGQDLIEAICRNWAPGDGEIAA